MEAELTDETVSGYTDTAVGGLKVINRFISRADCTLPYSEFAVQWYVPCAKCAKPWTALLSVCTLDVRICVFCSSLPLVMFMRLIAILVNKYHLFEYQSNMTFQTCFSISFFYSCYI